MNHERELRRIMARLQCANIAPLYPTMNYKLLSLRISIYKHKYDYTYEQLGEMWGVSLAAIQKWVKQTATPKKKHYNRIMDFLDNVA